MPISREEVLHVATLCRIALDEATVARLQKELSDILEHVSAVQAIDTKDVPPTGHAVVMHTVMREDEPRPPCPKEEVMKNAPRREGDFFRVHIILEES